VLFTFGWSFYDPDGNSLTPSLLRCRLVNNIESARHLMRDRLHPITGHPAPHNALIWRRLQGQKLLATGDGVVTRVATQQIRRQIRRGLIIQGLTSSRFLHLSKILVKERTAS